MYTPSYSFVYRQNKINVLVIALREKTSLFRIGQLFLTYLDSTGQIDLSENIKIKFDL